MWPRWLAPSITPKILNLAESDVLYDSLAHAPELANLFTTRDTAARRQWLRQKIASGVDNDRELQFTANDARPDVAVRLSVAMATAMRQQMLLAHLTEHSTKKEMLSQQLTAVEPLLLKARQDIQRAAPLANPGLTPTEYTLLHDMAVMQVGQLPNLGDPALLHAVPSFPSNTPAGHASHLVGRYQYYLALSGALRAQIVKENALSMAEITVGPMPSALGPGSPKAAVLLATGTCCGFLLGLGLIVLRRKAVPRSADHTPV
jgi:hypothetical protein